MIFDKRLDEAAKRLQRPAHLPAPLVLKCAAISSGVLSPFDYATLLIYMQASARIKASIRGGLGLLSVAPEIAFNLLTSGTLDPWLFFFASDWNCAGRDSNRAGQDI